MAGFKGMSPVLCCDVRFSSDTKDDWSCLDSSQAIPVTVISEWNRSQVNGRVCRNMEDYRMLSTNKVKITRLEPYMEVVGQFDELMEQDGVLLAEIANHIVILPVGMKEVLLPHIGSRIAILRTDLPGKEYLFRVLPDLEKTALMSENARAPDNCEASA